MFLASVNEELQLQLNRPHLQSPYRPTVHLLWNTKLQIQLICQQILNLLEV